MTEARPVPERDFYESMKRLRDVRAWTVTADIDAWAFRQAMITVLEMDTAVALERGVAPGALEAFDEGARLEAQAMIRGFKR